MSISQGLVSEENEDPGFEIIHLSFRKRESSHLYGGPVDYYIGNIVFRLTDPDAINRMKYYMQENEELRVAPDLELMEKYLHPKYAPVNRYATDIIGCLNNWVDGWIDWNMVLDEQGGPNWFKNWCVAPVIVDTKKDEVYFTPLYYVMSHFSKFMRPGAVKIACTANNKEVMTTAVKNPDGTIAVVIFNPTDKIKTIEMNLDQKKEIISINARALQTVLIKK